jgi:ABC-type transport system involved in cytochrome c biogenesis permease subunit
VKKLVSAPALFIGAGILLVVGVVLAFWYSPVDASSMGFSQKILYYHAPIAEAALVSFGVAFVAAIMYLRTQDLKWDRLGYVSVRIGLLFSILVMITGMIWGKAAWGTWWAWEPRLTTSSGGRPTRPCSPSSRSSTCRSRSSRPGSCLRGCTRWSSAPAAAAWRAAWR